MKKFSRQVVCGLLTSLCTTAVTAGDLSSSIQKALDTNPQVLIQKAETEAAKYRVNEESAGYLPVFNVRAGAGREYSRESFQTSDLNPGGSRGKDKLTRYDPSVSVRQKIFDGMRTPFGVERAKNELAQSNMNLIEAQVLVAFRVCDAYVNLLRFEGLLKLARDNVAMHRDIKQKIIQLVNAGKATNADLSSVQSRLNDAQAAADDIQGDYDTAVSNYVETVGENPHDISKPSIPVDQIPETLEAASRIASVKNRSVIVADSAVQVSRSELKATLSPFLPDFEFQGDLRRDYNTGGNKGIRANAIGQVVGTFNVYNGGRDLASRRRQRELVVAARLRKDLEVRRAIRETSVSYAEWLSAQNQTTSLTAAVNSKKKVKDIYMAQFEAGNRSFLDILDANHELFLAMGSLITAQSIQDLAALRVFASMGTLLEVMTPEFRQMVQNTELQRFNTEPSPVVYQDQDPNQDQDHTVTEDVIQPLSINQADALEKVVVDETL